MTATAECVIADPENPDAAELAPLLNALHDGKLEL